MQPGDYFVTRTGGFVAWCIRAITHSPVNHAGVFVGWDSIIEAQPGGAIWSDVSRYPDAIWSHTTLTDDQRNKIVAAARGAAGTPYNWQDVIAQGAVRLFGWHAPQWALDRLSNPKSLQCSQLVDYCYMEADVDLFDDDRPIGLVAPSDLYNLIRESA